MDSQRVKREKVCFSLYPLLYLLNTELCVFITFFIKKKEKNKALNTQKYTYSERVDYINSSLKHSACPTLPFRPQKDLSG